MPDPIYHPIIKNTMVSSITKFCTVSITYRNTKGQEVTFQPGGKHADGGNNDKRNNAVILFKTLDKYVTADSPNITPREQDLIRMELSKQIKPIHGMNGGYSFLDIYEGIDFVFKAHTSESSPGGKDITPNELADIYETIHSWTADESNK